jgi:hypothetical protein
MTKEYSLELQKYPTIFSHTAHLDDSYRNSDVIMLSDHMPHHADIRISVNGIPRYKKNTIIDLFNAANIDYTDKIFISDHYLLFEDFPNFIVNGDIFVDHAICFKKMFDAWKLSSKKQITKHLSFMSNKTREHRVLCSLLLANLFDVSEIDYSFSYFKDWLPVTRELMIDTDYKFDDKLLPENWIVHDEINEFPREVIGGYGFINTNVNSIFESDAVFGDTLFEKMYANSAISLITEPNFFEKGNMLTEKTLMSIYSGHFLIWVGGWKSAEIAKKVGIDVFDDIIDHSYQYIEHPGKRVVEAVLRNLNLLKDIGKQRELYNQHFERLNNNLQLVRDIPRLTSNIQSLNKIQI